jgi:HEPN domain-containing protein
MRQAKRDLEHTRGDLKSGYFEWACFSAHQAAEKAVKALFQHLHGEAREGMRPTSTVSSIRPYTSWKRCRRAGAAYWPRSLD